MIGGWGVERRGGGVLGREGEQKNNVHMCE